MNSEKNAGLTEIQILKLLHRNAWRIAGVGLAIGIGAALVSLLLPNIYQSTSALMIQDPELPLTGEAPPLTVESLKFLADSTEVKTELFQALQKAQALPPALQNFREFQKTLESKTPRKTGKELALLPILQLHVQTTDPATAMRIANGWSEIVLERSRAIYNAGVEDLKTFMSNIFATADKALIDVEQQHTSVTLSANLALSQAALVEQRKIYSRVYSEFLDLNEELGLTRGLVEAYGRQIDRQEVEGVWAGEFFNRKLRENPRPRFDNLTTSTQRVHQTSFRILESEARLAQFEQESRLQFLRMDLKNKEMQLSYISEETIRSKNQLAKSETEFEEMSKQLKGLQPKITLFKAITNDALWNAFTEGTLKKDGSLPLLQTEEINPVYQAIERQVIQLLGDIRGLSSRIDNYTSETANLQLTVSSLSKELAQQEAQRDNLVQAIKREKDLMTFMETEFNQIRQKYETQLRRLDELESQIGSKDHALRRLEQEVKDLERHVALHEIEIAALARDVENRRNLRLSLAGKAEEIDLLKLSLAKASRSGVALLYPAQANPEKVKPHRSRIALAALALGLVCAGFYFVFQGLVRET